MNVIIVMFGASWFFVVGSSFASFLNVVAWRLPRGRSILGSSHCPNCNIRLTLPDNIPIFGWLRNEGRCSNCRLPIHPRYLIVEIILGCIFLSASLTLFFTAGNVLPLVDRAPWESLNRMLMYPPTYLVPVLALHLTGLMSVFTFALIEQERLRIPFSILLAFAIGLVLICLIVPAGIVVPWEFPFRVVELPLNRLNLMISMAIGGLFGMLVGLGLSFFASTADAEAERSRVRPQLYFGMSIVGMFAGWQSVIVVAVLWLVGSRVIATNRKSEAALTVREILALPHSVLLIATLIHLVTWRWMEWWAELI